MTNYFEPLIITLVDQSLTAKKKDRSAERVEKILTNPDSPDVPHLEAEINKLVYALYDLTPEEIEIVEGKR